MIDDKKIIEIENRDNGVVGYIIPDLGNLYRRFEPKEVKKVSMEELRKLYWLPGGEKLLRDCLVIRDEGARAELLGEVEPEYIYTESQVNDILLKGSLEELEDCLDFAPQGVRELVKSQAVNLKIADIYKRQAIKDMTGFDVTKAIEINEESEKQDIETKSRRVAPTETHTAQRRVPSTQNKITILKDSNK